MKLSQWLGLACLVMAAYVAWQIRQLLLLLFLAIVLTTALNRLVKQLQHWGLPRPVALSLTFMAIATFLLGFLGLIIPPFWEQLQDLLSVLPQVGRRIQEFIRSQLDILDIQELTQIFSVDALPNSLSTLGTNAFINLTTFFPIPWPLFP